MKKFFCDHLILGTHDSGASMGYLYRNFNYVTESLICQYSTISQQFDMGVRFFDLRVNGDLEIVHGGVSPIFGTLKEILLALKKKVQSNNSFAVISLKLDRGKLDNTNILELDNMTSNFDEFNADSFYKSNQLYIFNRIENWTTFTYMKLSHDGYSTLKNNKNSNVKNIFIQDCFKFTNLIKAEWRDKRDSIIKCDKNKSKLKINFTSFTRGVLSIKWDPTDYMKDAFKLFNPVAPWPIKVLPNPLRSAVEINKWLIGRNPHEFKSNVYLVDGLTPSLAKKMNSLPQFLM